MARSDYERQSPVYDEGRSLPAEATELHMIVARRHAPVAERVLDLGSGTGRFSAALADAYDATVIGIEPSAGMRSRAATKRHARVHVLAGCAEALPLRDGSIDLAWLSNVTHHFDDLAEAARELRRVIEPEGTVLIRGSFPGREHPSLYRFFPGSRAIVDSFRSLPDTMAAFQDAGFTSFYNELVSYRLADSLAEMVPRIRTRADTALELLSDEEFAAGLRELEQAARVEHDPVLDSLDLLVVR